MDFFIEDDAKTMWHRIVTSEIIMCEEVGRLVYVYRKGKPVIATRIAIDGFHREYLKGMPDFIRTSSAHIVNKNMIVSMSERKGTLYLELEEKREALIRRGHEFVYMIKTNRKKPDTSSEIYKEHQEFIDKIISTYSDCNVIKKHVEEKTNIKLTTKYIRDRYKTIKYS